MLNYLISETPTLGDLLQQGNQEREFVMQIDFAFWMKLAIIIFIVCLVLKLVIKPSKESQERTRRMNENIKRNKSRMFGGGSRDLSHNSGNPHYKQGGCRNGCGSCIVHGCTKKDENGNLILDKDGKEQTHYNSHRCINCKNNSWCICCMGKQ